jgi:arsenate reductase
VVDLTKTPPTAEALAQLCRKLGASPREILRRKDPAYAALGLGSGRHSERQLLELMAQYPGLIQRPIVVKGGRAILARPVEALAAFLK